MLFIPPGSRRGAFAVSLTAGLLALTRPDSLLAVGASGALFLATWVAAPARLPLRDLWRAWPLVLPALHATWRWRFYGEWLPNTYWAKHVAPWPEAGLRYLASYGLEYGLWFWALAAGLALGLSLRGFRPTLAWLPAAAAIGTVLAHAGYYVLCIGGDHFEYRIFSHSVPLVLVSSVWIANRLVERAALPRAAALLVPLAIVLLAAPLPWTIWSQGRAATTRQASFNLTTPLAPVLPGWLRGYAARLDGLQRWLIVDHAIGKRYHEHRVFVDFRKAMFPRERQLEKTDWPAHSVYSAISVGTAGWVLADAHVIDRAGLNDYVIARSPIHDVESRRMAHDRRPPDGYLSCFHPNVVDGNPTRTLRAVPQAELRKHGGEIRVHAPPTPLSADDIRRCEALWRLWVSGQ